MTSGSFGGSSGYPVPIVPGILKDDDDVTTAPDEPRDASQEEISEEAAVAESIDSPESDQAIESLRPAED